MIILKAMCVKNFMHYRHIVELFIHVLYFTHVALVIIISNCLLNIKKIVAYEEFVYSVSAILIVILLHILGCHVL
jgi:hypothetical protein